MTAASKEVAKKLGAKLSLTDKVFDPTQARPLFDQLLSQNTTLIFAHSFSFAELVKELARKEPGHDVRRLGRRRESEGQHLDLDVQLSRDGVLAVLARGEAVEVRRDRQRGCGKGAVQHRDEPGCRLGAKAANPKAKVLEAYTNDFVDQQKGREVGQSLLDRGADVLFVSGGTDSSLGALALCGAKKVPCFSTAYDNRSVAPAYVVSSTYNNWRPWLTQVITAAAAGKLKTFTYDGTFGNGGLAATPFNGPSAKLVPASTSAAVQGDAEAARARRRSSSRRARATRATAERYHAHGTAAGRAITSPGRLRLAARRS